MHDRWLGLVGKHLNEDSSCLAIWVVRRVKTAIKQKFANRLESCASECPTAQFVALLWMKTAGLCRRPTWSIPQLCHSSAGWLYGSHSPPTQHLSRNENSHGECSAYCLLRREQTVNVIICHFVTAPNISRRQGPSESEASVSRPRAGNWQRLSRASASASSFSSPSQTRSNSANRIIKIISRESQSCGPGTRV